MITFQQISEITGFDCGDRFLSDTEVREYFKRENLASCLADDEKVRRR